MREAFTKLGLEMVRQRLPHRCLTDVLKRVDAAVNGLVERLPEFRPIFGIKRLLCRCFCCLWCHPCAASPWSLSLVIVSGQRREFIRGNKSRPDIHEHRGIGQEADGFGRGRRVLAAVRAACFLLLVQTVHLAHDLADFLVQQALGGPVGILDA